MVDEAILAPVLDAPAEPKEDAIGNVPGNKITVDVHPKPGTTPEAPPAAAPMEAVTDVCALTQRARLLQPVLLTWRPTPLLLTWQPDLGDDLSLMPCLMWQLVWMLRLTPQLCCHARHQEDYKRWRQLCKLTLHGEMQHHARVEHGTFQCHVLQVRSAAAAEGQTSSRGRHSPLYQSERCSMTSLSPVPFTWPVGLVWHSLPHSTALEGGFSQSPSWQSKAQKLVEQTAGINAADTALMQQIPTKPEMSL